MGWAKAVRMRKKKHDVEIRARIILRRTLGREPTAEDMAQAFEIDRNFADVTEDEIIEAYNGGKEVCQIPISLQSGTHHSHCSSEDLHLVLQMCCLRRGIPE